MTSCLNLDANGAPAPFPVIGDVGNDVAIPGNVAGTRFFLQDTRDFYAHHGLVGNVLFADGSTRPLNDDNGDGYFNPGFAITSATTPESTGYLDDICEVNPWDMYPGCFLDVQLPVKDFDSDP